MRGSGWIVVFAVVLVFVCPVAAQDDEPAATSMIPAPLSDVPSIIKPSEPPTGYVAPLPLQRLPETERVELTGNVRVETDEQTGKASRVIVTGPVTVKYRDLVITADDGADVDFKTNEAAFRGNVVLRIDGQEAALKSLTVNLKTREWSGRSVTTTINPQFAKGYLEAPVFARGASVSGRGKRELDVFSADSTTCDLADPHYKFIARSVEVYPDDKIVMKNVTMFALGKKLFTIPRFAIPIKQIQRNPNVIPRTGQSAEEGYFIKAAYPYLATRTQTGSLLLDAMTRKGIGKGIQHTWKSGSTAGLAEFYHLYDNNINQNTMTGRFLHSQMSGTCRLGVSSDFRSNSYLYAPGSKSLVNQFTLTRDRTGANTHLSFSQNINDAFVRSVNLSGNLHHRQQFGPRTLFDTSFDYISFDSTGQPTRARLESDVVFSRKENSFDWSLSAVKFTDLSDEAFIGQGGFAGIEKQPEFGISTDSARLKRTLFGLPANMRFTYGQYVELPVNTQRNRAFFSLDTPSKSHQVSHTWSLTTGAGFKQYAYSDGTAQYSFDVGAQLAKKLGPSSAFNLTYRCQKPRGFTPFRSDYVGRYNVINGSLDLKDNRKFRASLLTGYNFQQTSFAWQDVVLRVSIEPSKSFLLYTATSYDLNRGQWRTLINQLRFRGKRDFKLDIGTRYDPINKQLATLRARLDTPIADKTRIEALAGYNGFTKKFDYRGFALTRDLHCWEASIAFIDQPGFYANKGFTMSLRIKAFPFFREFGVGPFGQPQDTSVGQVY